MFGRNDGDIVRAEVIAERRRGVRLGRVDHDGAPVESEAFGGAIAEAVTAFPRAGAGIGWRLCPVIPLPAGARCNRSVSDRIGWAEHHGWSGSDALPHAPRAR